MHNIQVRWGCNVTLFEDILKQVAQEMLGDESRDIEVRAKDGRLEDVLPFVRNILHNIHHKHRTQQERAAVRLLEERRAAAAEHTCRPGRK